MLAVEPTEAGGTTSNMNTNDTSTTPSSSRYHAERDQGGRKHFNSRRSGTNSSNDPSFKSSRLDKPPSNSRHHPKAELSRSSKGSIHHSSLDASRDTRKRRNGYAMRQQDDEYSEDVWTEHRSSSGKTYYYNKALDKSQWEKPTRGVVKKFKPEPHTPPNRQAGSHSMKTHSHAGGSEGKDHHHHHHGNRHSDGHYQNRKRYDKKMDNVRDKKSTNHPLTSAGDKTSSPSPVSVGHTPNTPIPSSRLSLVGTPEMGASPCMAVISSCPTTPVTHMMGVAGWNGNMETTPITSDGLHPLQRAVLIQNQQQQQYYTTQSGTYLAVHSLPTTPMYSMAPPPGTPTGVPPPPPIHYQNLPYHPEQPLMPLPALSHKLNAPMSKLGKWPHLNDNFPDPSLLKSLSPLPTNDLFNPSLAQNWIATFDSCLKQIDSCHMETLSRTTVDSSYHSGQLAKNLLALECCRIKTVSRRTRISDLQKTIDTIHNDKITL